MFREKIKNNEKTIGTLLNLNDVSVARIEGLSGYDFVWIDFEHSNLSIENILGHILAIKATGTAVVVRVPQNDLTFTKKILEMGVDGIIFPMVRRVEEINEQIANTLYPPHGTRGFGPINAIGYGMDSVSKYVNSTCDEICRFIQIEHIDVVENLEEVIKNEYIDGYIFGPNDLSGSINKICQPFDCETVELMERSLEILKRNGKYSGVATGDTSEKTLKRFSDMGIDMLVAGADFSFLLEGSLKNRANLERIHKNPEILSKKVYYTKENLTPDVDCALLPPTILGKEAAKSDFFSEEKRKWTSAPCVCKMPNGELYCTFSADNNGGDEDANNYSVIMKSKDEGKTWETITIIDHPDSVRLHEPILWKDEDDVLWHLWSQSYEWWDGRAGVWAMKAKFLGDEIVWSKPKRLCNGVLANTPITLADGSIIMPVSIWKWERVKWHYFPKLQNSSVYISYDRGESFHYVGGADESETIFDENMVVERKDKSLYMIIRGRDKISYSISYDKGKNWSEPEKLMDHTGSRSFITKFPSGRYLLITNDDAKARKNMAAFLSEDECKTWTKKLMIDERFSTTYPSGCVTSDGRVYVAYDYNRYDDEEIYIASFTEKELCDGKISDENSFLKRLVVKGLDGKKTDKVFEGGEGYEG